MALTRRQKQIYDFVRSFIEERGYSPSLEEIGRHFGLSSVATVHKHVTNLVRKGLLRRSWNQNRSIEVVGENEAPRAVEVPLLGRVHDARPVETGVGDRTIALPAWLVGSGRTYALRAADDSLRGEAIRRGDVVVIEERRSAHRGDLVLALVPGGEVRFFRFDGRAVEEPDPAGMPRLPEEEVEIRGVVRAVVRRC
ncbi:MAG: repressor LexA [Acidobacteria bacterium]|nr:MAG: repressor LexA [Acidobacteriota bacterium]